MSLSLSLWRAGPPVVTGNVLDKTGGPLPDANGGGSHSTDKGGPLTYTRILSGKAGGDKVFDSGIPLVDSGGPLVDTESFWPRPKKRCYLDKTDDPLTDTSCLFHDAGVHLVDAGSHLADKKPSS